MRRLKASELKSQTVVEAHMSFADLVDGRRVLHGGDPMLDQHVRHGGVVGSAAKWVFDRGPGETHGLWAAAGAVHLLVSGPEPRRGRREIIVADDEPDEPDEDEDKPG
jgi:hypothetical protein